MTPYFETRDGAIQIWHGDALDVLPTLGPVDHVITDPPYEAEAHTLQRRILNPRTQALRMAPLDFAAITSTVRDAASLAIAPLAKRWVLTFCQIEAAMIWRDAYAAGGLRYVRSMAWVKPNGHPQLTGDRPSMGYETILAMHSPDERLKWNGGGRMGWFSCPVDANFSREPRLHPTQKPMKLMRELVSLFTDPGETILDPFAGSGTTGRAALDLGRKAILVEKEERWCETAAKRMSQAVLL